MRVNSKSNREAVMGRIAIEIYNQEGGYLIQSEMLQGGRSMNENQLQVERIQPVPIKSTDRKCKSFSVIQTQSNNSMSQLSDRVPTNHNSPFLMQFYKGSSIQIVREYLFFASCHTFFFNTFFFPKRLCIPLSHIQQLCDIYETTVFCGCSRWLGMNGVQYRYANKNWICSLKFLIFELASHLHINCQLGCLAPKNNLHPKFQLFMISCHSNCRRRSFIPKLLLRICCKSLPRQACFSSLICLLTLKLITVQRSL